MDDDNDGEEGFMSCYEYFCHEICKDCIEMLVLCRKGRSLGEVASLLACIELYIRSE